MKKFLSVPRSSIRAVRSTFLEPVTMSPAPCPMCDGIAFEVLQEDE
jgi:hypothetical protein